jgi:hypothetical protein
MVVIVLCGSLGIRGVVAHTDGVNPEILKTRLVAVPAGSSAEDPALRNSLAITPKA